MTECQKKSLLCKMEPNFLKIMDDHDHNSLISKDTQKNIAPCLLVVVITETDAGQREDRDQTEISAHRQYLPITGLMQPCKPHLCSASDVTHPGAALCHFVSLTITWICAHLMKWNCCNLFDLYILELNCIDLMGKNLHSEMQAPCENFSINGIRSKL